MKKLIKIAGMFLLVAAVLAGGIGYYIYNRIYDDNVLNYKSEYELFIPSNANYDDVLEILQRDSILIDFESFKWVAVEMNYPNRVHPGRYLIKDHWGNRKIVSQLRLGEQNPVKVVINKFRTRELLAGHVSRFIEADSLELLHLLTDSAELAARGLTYDNAFGLIIPNTYELFWNTDASTFLGKMKKEYHRFWNSSRVKLAEEKKLTPAEAIVVASIVEEESNKKDELRRIAGVYLNRLQKGIKLQADPTVRYAIGNFELQRILNVHLNYDSPYNTYVYKGLPPGPICTPSIATIDAVLNAEDHDYIFFCAKPDFSGYHVFAKTLSQHNKNARNFHRALNERNIK